MLPPSFRLAHQRSARGLFSTHTPRSAVCGVVRVACVVRVVCGACVSCVVCAYLRVLAGIKRHYLHGLSVGKYVPQTVASDDQLVAVPAQRVVGVSPVPREVPTTWEQSRERERAGVL